MSTVVLLAVTGLGLGALYFLVASGLSLIFGLMDVLNFAHGALLSVGAYATWWAADGHLPGAGSGGPGFVLAVCFGTAVGTVAAMVLELALIRPLYDRPREQVLATVGVGLAVPALLSAIWGPDARPFPGPAALSGTFGLLGAHIPVNRLVLIGAAAAVLVALRLFLGGTRHGLVVRAGVEDRAMVTALGIDVRRAFTLVFAIGGAAAALGGALGGLYYGSVDPGQGTSLLIFAFVVVVMGGMGSVAGAALAAVGVGLVQQFANYYTASGLGDLAVVVLLAALLLLKPRGITGRLA
ncbi:branched-chain amino acid ABC transporter permease [Streptomyces cocklensis]|jgi:branched-chain amino acid transport system permease protein|uniref:Amino acid/amide ABC transporter membrane protein 1, HAAT family n=1 Tax=Actinacidiphila cocklensis TaxID=887465 RepID=A0A9W4GQ80_9ACTN|nr:branched-chain amino acid ABC transporter permease [Actinacidiphila cocklensis]MDD1061910.1 branched-chain amino acid ABC transporter permease [Actinacidiphila cocklensis]WSX74653.1 branched-chain amino acid ABC transporter permease [Streptomyces sp. NBC_00899]CAG6391301.1 Amino acid/amide ABC transporter membrane protein 1, HAAT family [Actinacidiphila cocklensis]